MTQQRQIPDEESRKKCLERLRETNRQLDLYNLQLDELIAMIEAEARQQKRERLLKKYNNTN
ncbi:hypothetical protein C7H19_00535 [Aphanothece hegewaldii CCALA 016]|uniref:Uncharacterized protein n=1 Tax=Aphanothece hegewaldii CCALA 016 TaxID=2107694 RepID=A0A2T1M397_9CHRO|nr:hypothetical protein [Aphanothece hegewaldii]PSF39309.1 hypothetical protein C7H19_00535 [Aphanothece hegewaldii CCALA 016]